jgi:hypothetical protein
MIATADVDAALMTTASACTLSNKGVPTAVVALFRARSGWCPRTPSLSSLSGPPWSEVCCRSVRAKFRTCSAGTGEAGVRPIHAPACRKRHGSRQPGAAWTGDCALLSEPAATLAEWRRTPARDRERPFPPSDWIPGRLAGGLPQHPELALGALAMVGPLARMRLHGGRCARLCPSGRLGGGPSPASRGPVRGGLPRPGFPGRGRRFARRGHPARHGTGGRGGGPFSSACSMTCHREHRRPTARPGTLRGRGMRWGGIAVTAVRVGRPS